MAKKPSAKRSSKAGARKGTTAKNAKGKTAGIPNKPLPAVDPRIPGVDSAWMGPNQPLTPMAQEVRGRLWDTPVAFNLNYQPRAQAALSFEDLKMLADSCGVLRNVIETRKNQILALDWMIRPITVKGKKADPNQSGQYQAQQDYITNFFKKPSADDDWAQWIRKILENLFVYDAVSLLKNRTRGGALLAIEAMDGATISVKLDMNGMTPATPAVAYQQVLKGLPAVDLTTDDLLYYPNNRRAGEPYGYPHVQQIYSYVDMAIKRIYEQIAYYKDSNIPRGMIEGPAGMTVDQIVQMQQYWESILSGQIDQRSKAWWVPQGSKYTAFSQEALFEEFDEWLARVICACFQTAPTPYIKQNNRATAQKAGDDADDAGLVPTMQYVKRLLDRIIAEDFGQPQLEFAWNENVEFSPKDRAEIDDKNVRNGTSTIDEVREARGQDPFGGAASQPMVMTATGYVPVDPEEAGALKQQFAPKPSALSGAAGGPPKPGAPAATKAPAKPTPIQKDVIGPFLVKRAVLNPLGLITWAKANDISLPSVLEMQYHVAVLPPAVALPDGALTLDQILLDPTDGTRKIEHVPDTGAVLSFDSAELGQRWNDMRNRGLALDDQPPETFYVVIDPRWNEGYVGVTPYDGPVLLGEEEVVDLGMVMKASLEEIDAAAHRAAYLPTTAQAKAGNYRKGHVRLYGLDITVETPAGAARRGPGWSVLMPVHYGYIKRTTGADEEQVDVFLGPDPASDLVWIIDQAHAYGDGGFDEHKVLLAFDSWKDAREAYVNSFSDGKEALRIGGVTQMTVAEFKTWLATSDTTKPASVARHSIVGKTVTTATGLTYHSEREKKELDPENYHIWIDEASSIPQEAWDALVNRTAAKRHLEGSVRKVVRERLPEHQEVRGRNGRPFRRGRGSNLPRTLRFAKEYNEDQPRDDHGRWVDAAGRGADHQVNTKAFKDWFGNSTVVHIQDGSPKVVYHSTHADWSEYDPNKVGLTSLGFHAGTKEQAEQVQHTGGTSADVGASRPEEGMRIMPVYLKIEHPLRLEDSGTWSSWQMPDKLAAAGVVDRNSLPSDARSQVLNGRHWDSWSGARQKYEYSVSAGLRERLKADPGMSRSDYQDLESKTGNAYIRDVIKQNGYDGVVYANQHEGHGDSYIVFDPAQIKSALGNRGTFDPKQRDITRFVKAAGRRLIGPIDPAKEVRAAAQYKRGVSAALKAMKPKVMAQIRHGLDHLRKAEDDDQRWADLAQKIADGLDLGTLQLLIDDAIAAGGIVAEDAARVVLAAIGAANNSSLVNQVDERAAEWARTRAAELIGMGWSGNTLVPSANAAMAIDETTRDMIRQLIYDGLRNADTKDEIATAIEDSTLFSEERAQLIAAAEISRAHSAGALIGGQQARDAGNDVKKYWGITDEETCPICQDNADDGLIDLDEEFSSGDLTTPAHPRCRCYQGLEANPGTTEDDEPVNLAAVGRAFLKYSEDQPRDDHGMWTTGGTGSGTKWTWEAHKQFEKLAQGAARSLGYDPEKVYVSDTPQTFELNGRTLNAAGMAYVKGPGDIRHSKGDIVLFRDAFTPPEPIGIKDVKGEPVWVSKGPTSIMGVMAHEVEHQRFQTVLDRYSEDNRAISAEMARIKADGGNPFAPRQGVMKPDGSIRPEYAGRFPTYEAINPFMEDIHGLAATDGVSSYSRMWWDAWTAGKAQTDQAVHETLAEMASNVERSAGENRFVTPEGTMTNTGGSAQWRNFYTTVNGLYDGYQKEKK